jgi:DNA-binding CsgD family transcriptional regulator
MEMAARTPAPGDVLGRLALTPFTFAETMKLLGPIGIDRQTAELNLKYGVRDIFTCPIGGRWILSYWAPKPMPLQQDQRALLYLGALFATTQLQKLSPLSSERLSKGHALTPRELSVLRSLSLGYRAAQISKDLGLGEETIRSHIKKAQAKLGARLNARAF